VKDPEYTFCDSENKPTKQSKVKPEAAQAAAERADRVRRCGRVDYNDQVTTPDEHLFYDTKPTKGEHQVTKEKNVRGVEGGREREVWWGGGA
jgi:hypothetical protein